MLESNNLVTFEGLANSSAYHTFLLDEEKGRLVVGAKDHIFSFNLLNISKDYAQVRPRICGLLARRMVSSIQDDKSVYFLTDLLPALSLCNSSILGLSVSTEESHEYFRTGLSHTITRCARHVSCSLHTWMNNGVN